MAKITIDGKICECDEGEYILQVARRCGVFIPALCYLSGGTPTLACRLCMVEADGKRFELKGQDALYVPQGTKSVLLGSADGANL